MTLKCLLIIPTEIGMSISPVLACQANHQGFGSALFFLLHEAEHLDSMSFLCPCFYLNQPQIFDSRDCAAESVTVTLSLGGGIEFLSIVSFFCLFFYDMARRQTSLQRAASANHFHKTVCVDGMLLVSVSPQIELTLTAKYMMYPRKALFSFLFTAIASPTLTFHLNPSLSST